MSKKVQANLKIQLLAEKVVVAESEDPQLWQKVLAAILGEQPNIDQLGVSDDPSLGAEDIPKDSSSPIDEFTGLLEIDKNQIVGALSPSDKSPFLHLDARTWEAFKQNYPSRGSNAVPAIVLAGTAVALWFKVMDVESPTQAQAKAVLKTIDATGANPTRSLRNCDWLQNRNGRIIINPARISDAIELVRNFCLKQGPNE